jgi:PhnB protein
MGRSAPIREETTVKQVNPYLNFLGTTEEAFRFYHSVFDGNEPAFVRYRDMGMAGPDDRDGDLVAHASLPIGANTVLMASDVAGSNADTFRIGDNVQIYIAADDLDEGQRLFDALAAGGTITMPFERTAWAERFGACIDRFGVNWSIDYTGDVQFE